MQWVEGVSPAARPNHPICCRFSIVTGFMICGLLFERPYEISRELSLSPGLRIFDEAAPSIVILIALLLFRA
jgi:hypothetical protein